MARSTPIRIREKDKREYQRLVKNTKEKIRYHKNKYGVDLSSEVNIPKLSEFNSRGEFNTFKSQMTSFTNRANTRYQFVKNKHGVVASKKEINYIKRKNKQAIEKTKKLREEIRNLPFFTKNKQEGKVKDEMKKMSEPDYGGVNVPQEFDFDKIEVREILDDKKKSYLDKIGPNFFEKKNTQMQENFIDVLEKSFNSNADKLIEEIEKLAPDDFFEVYMMNREFDFNLYYVSEDEVDMNDGDINTMLKALRRYNEGEVDKSLKGF